MDHVAHKRRSVKMASRKRKKSAMVDKEAVGSSPELSEVEKKTVEPPVKRVSLTESVVFQKLKIK